MNQQPLLCCSESRRTETGRGEGGGEESRVGGGSAYVRDGRIEPNIGSIVNDADIGIGSILAR